MFQVPFRGRGNAVVCLLILALALTFFVSPAPVNAQSVSAQCIFGGLPTVQVADVEPVSVESVYALRLDVVNGSQYVFSDVELAVAFYETENDTVPAYWTTTEELYTLESQTDYPVSIPLDLTNLPAGSYFVRAFLAQGGFDNLLTAALTGSQNAPALELTKTTDQVSDIETTVLVNNQSLQGQVISLPDFSTIAVSAVTENNNPIPFTDAELHSVITYGTIPAGTAVSKTFTDSVKLIPGADREAEYSENKIIGGVHTVYTVVDKANTPLPLSVATVQIGEELVEEPVDYMAGVGYHSGENGFEVAACANRLSDSEEVTFPSDIGFRLLNGDDVIEEVVLGDEGTLGNSVVFSSVNTAEELSVQFITGDLPDFSNAPEGDSQVELSFREFEVAETIEVECLEGMCGEFEELTYASSAVPAGEKDNTPSFYYYLGIVLAAALLMYIMLRRLHPYQHPSEEMNSNEDTELQ